ncbi:MAG TPA: bifunctional UDP-N-acetylglucosamine diphosphorylase/glucosamine-1-phosphate N-acetyltransferase GlmU [Nitrospiria bacterium]|jgi:bifunctional UDP-N-acetylglucosamine pyrophosphorylase/glucosamine-1-phosphate N-acetyltransferase
MNRLGVLILAAGLGKRMRSKKAKVLHPLCGKPVILYLVDRSLSLKPDVTIAVVGHQGKEVQALVKNRGIKIVRQEKQLGTGHAALQAQTILKRFQGDLLILNGDTPLLTQATLQQFLLHHRETGSTLSLLTAVLKNPTGYGRILRNSPGDVLRVVEQKDATSQVQKIQEVNGGIYLVDPGFLFKALKNLKKDNAQKEYYLTDIVEEAVRNKKKVTAWVVPEAAEILGVNSRKDFSVAETMMRRQILENLMDRGVTVIDPATTYVDEEVLVGQDSVLYPSTFLEGRTQIGEGCVIGPWVHIIDSCLGNGVLVRNGCVVKESILEDTVSVGPFTHLRAGTVLKKEVRIGNFVEIKKSELGKGSKANHLSYIGDAEIGKGVNIGAGTITCNYDGNKKSKTVIGDGVFVGSDTQLVAPVKVGRKAMIAAGSTITRDVPPGALAINRVQQENKTGWVKKRNLRAKKPTQKRKS